MPRSVLWTTEKGDLNHRLNNRVNGGQTGWPSTHTDDGKTTQLAGLWTHTNYLSTTRSLSLMNIHRDLVI